VHIDIKKLRLKFPEAEQRQFTDLDISIEKGEKVLLLGPSGSGKSTLLNVLGGIIPRTIDVPLKYDRLKVQSAAAYVFQDPDSQFTMPTVGEELAFVLENRQVPKEEMKDRMNDALYRSSLDVSLERTINSLSGGMKQKLAIASCLLQGSETLLLDEPTSMLDESSVKSLWDTVEKVWEDKTVVIVEHRVNLIWNKVDRVILMDSSGELVVSGTPEEVFRKHLKLLNEYGVWHPESWASAPLVKPLIPADEVLLEIRDMTLQRGKQVLLYIDNLKIYKGEWLTLEGQNGTGKTSLMLSLMKLIKTDSMITIRGGKRVKKTKDIAGFMYPVFQNPELQFITNKVFDEVFINLEQHYSKEEAEQKTSELLKKMSLEHVSHLHPLEISTGQKRRLSVATATGGIPKIIILDEPTFGLDQTLAFKFIEIFHRLAAAGTTIIMITHDEEIKKRYPSRRLKIVDGRLIEPREGETDARSH
jgi:energy-coupling factor transporter ATP-binding protein EcfA2